MNSAQTIKANRIIYIRYMGKKKIIFIRHPHRQRQLLLYCRTHEDARGRTAAVLRIVGMRSLARPDQAYQSLFEGG
jgi:hypothetical protein